MLRVLLSNLGTKIHGIIFFHISLNSCFIKSKANFGVSRRSKIKSDGVWERHVRARFCWGGAAWPVGCWVPPETNTLLALDALPFLHLFQVEFLIACNDLLIPEDWWVIAPCDSGRFPSGVHDLQNNAMWRVARRAPPETNSPLIPPFFHLFEMVTSIVRSCKYWVVKKNETSIRWWGSRVEEGRLDTSCSRRPNWGVSTLVAWRGLASLPLNRFILSVFLFVLLFF